MKRVSVQAYLSRLAAGAAMIAYPASAWAQASTAAQSDQAAESSVGVEDIVVTAQRRSESVQKRTSSRGWSTMMPAFIRCCWLKRGCETRQVPSGSRARRLKRSEIGRAHG